MIQAFIEQQQVKLQKRVEKYKEDLASGRVSDFAEYKRVVGMIAGIREAMAEADETKKKFEAHDDDNLEEMKQ